MKEYNQKNKVEINDIIRRECILKLFNKLEVFKLHGRYGLDASIFQASVNLFETQNGIKLN